ncbi:MAG: flavodoxin [Thermoplasmatota archaeon]
MNKADDVNIVVVYYSYEGNTRFIAQCIAEEINADMLGLKPVKEMNSKGFFKYFWGGKKVVFKQKPELLAFDKNPNEYDIIFIGTPVWALTFTPAIRTFFSTIHLKNKKIALFCCHEGSMGKTLNNMTHHVSDNDIVGVNDFFNPLKDMREQNKKKAKKWAGEIINNIL